MIGISVLRWAEDADRFSREIGTVHSQGGKPLRLFKKRMSRGIYQTGVFNRVHEIIQDANDLGRYIRFEFAGDYRFRPEGHRVFPFNA